MASIPPVILDRLRCPTCEQALAPGEDSALVCAGQHRWPIRDGVLDCAPAALEAEMADTAESFGYEWTHFDAVRPGDEVDWHDYFAEVPPGVVEGAIVVDAGCGMGRYTRITASRADAVIAIDLSDAVVAAARNLAGVGQVLVVRADLRRPPVAPASVDLVTSLGVLHHIPEPEAGFQSLVELVRPGGHLLVYVYSRGEPRSLRGAALRAAAALRRVTVRMPHRLLRALSIPIAGALTVAVVAPGRLGDRIRFEPLSGLPMRYYRSRPVRDLWLDTFDRLSAPIEHRHTVAELEGWAARAGLDVVAIREDAGVFLVARKP